MLQRKIFNVLIKIWHKGLNINNVIKFQIQSGSTST